MSQLKQPKQLINLDSRPIIFDEDYIWETDEDYMWENDDFCLKESDFYPPLDNRIWKSIIEDIEGGDNFADFCDEYFKMLEEEDYWEN